MKLLRVITSMDPASGGPCQGIRNSIPELEKLGVTNEVLSLDDPASAFLRNDSFPIHAIGAHKGPWRYNANLIPWLRNNLGRFDAVIVHGLWAFHSYGVTKAIQQIRDKKGVSNNQTIPKLFVMPHGMLDPYFQRAPERRLKAVRNWIYWKLIEAKVVNEADGVFFTCEEELLLARQTFLPYTPKVEINVGYGIQSPPAFKADMREAFLQKCPQVLDQPYILFLSRIHEKKGADLLVRAYAKKRTDVSPKLVIAGPGLESSYGQKIQQLVSESEDLKSSVFFPGMLTGDAKWGAFYGCQAFALPSHQENFGIAVVEALACTKPVLISDQVNIWREIELAGSGMVSADTFEGTEKLLGKWLTLTKEEQEAMGARSRRLYEKSFSVAPAAKSLLNAIKK